MAEIKISDDAIIRQIIWAVRDPGSIVPRNGHKESDDDWTARAVRCVLGGRLLPPGGPSATQYGCRTVDGLHGEKVTPNVTRKGAEMDVSYRNRIYATRSTYTGRAELVSREIHTGPWSPVVSDSTGGGAAPMSVEQIRVEGPADIAPVISLRSARWD